MLFRTARLPARSRVRKRMTRHWSGAPPASTLAASEEMTMAAPLTIRLHPADNVVVARMDILPGTGIEGGVAAATRVPPGHKILTRAVKQGEPLRKYNQIIGFATED